MKKTKPVLLLILDGWGASHETRGNAISAAKTPTWDKLLNHYPNTEIEGCGECVGLPAGQMGNSEVGHLTLGAGRVIYQDLTKINRSITDGSFFKLENVQKIFNPECSSQALHIMGLLSPGGVHSHESHVTGLLEHYKSCGLPIFLHAFLDGRDTAPKQARESLEKLNSILSDMPNVKLATIMGRFYAMDRDNRWDRIQQAFEAIAHAQGAPFASATEALEHYYNEGITDEFIPPCIIGTTHPGLKPSDRVLFMNFRSDRARELSHALATPSFDAFNRGVFAPISLFTLTEYDNTLPATVLLPKKAPKNGLGEYFQSLGLKQLRVAETEKYAHVTFFFNGGLEKAFDGETRILVPSPNVKTYDLKPEMSAKEVTQALVEAIHSDQYDAIICNFANADMVGHTGNFQATIEAVECLDSCLNQILSALDDKGGAALITADHGNADCMFEVSSDNPHTAHTLAKVPLVYYGQVEYTLEPQEGSLQDVAPTLLTIMGLTPPSEMTGKSLLRHTTHGNLK